MKTPITKRLIISSVAALVMLAGSQAMAFSVGFSLGDVLEKADRTEIRESSQSSGSALRWWSLFQDKLPERRAQEDDSAPDRGLGDWLDAKHSGRSDHIDEVIGKDNVALLGIDGRARLMFFKKKFLKGIMLALRFKRSLFAHYEDIQTTPVPLPAPILLFGSSLVGLLTFYRRRQISGRY